MLIAMKQDWELLGYAALYWIFHLRKVSSSDMEMVFPTILEFLHSHATFRTWIYAYVIASRGMKSAMIDTIDTTANGISIELAIPATMIEMLLSTSSNGFDIFDRQIFDDEQLCKAMYNITRQKRFHSLTNFSKDRFQGDEERISTKFMFKNSAISYAQHYLGASEAEEIRISGYSSTHKTYPLYLKLTVLIRLAMINKCTEMLDHLVTTFPEGIARDLQSLISFGIAVSSEDMFDCLIKKKILVYCDFSRLLTSAIHADEPIVLRLLLRYNPLQVNSWNQFDTHLRTVIKAKKEDLLFFLLNGISTVAREPVKGSLHQYLLVAISQGALSTVMMLFRFQAPTDLNQRNEAMTRAVEAGDPEVFRFLVQAYPYPDNKERFFREYLNSAITYKLSQIVLILLQLDTLITLGDYIDAITLAISFGARDALELLAEDYRNCSTVEISCQLILQAHNRLNQVEDIPQEPSKLTIHYVRQQKSSSPSDQRQYSTSQDRVSPDTSYPDKHRISEEDTDLRNGVLTIINAANLASSWTTWVPNMEPITNDDRSIIYAYSLG